MEKETKNKFKKIFKGIYVGITTILSFGFIACLAVGCSQRNKTQVACAESETINVEVNKKFVSYNDESYTITLNTDELNNYTWTNFKQFVSNQTIVGGGRIGTFQYLTYNGTFSLSSSSDIKFLSGQFGASDYVRFNDLDNGIWTFTLNGNVDDFSSDFVITFDSSEVYSSYKNAIELDIQANSGTITDGIFETLTESSVSFIGTIGSGITAMVGVFYDSTNSQLTTIGLLSVIVVSIGLAYFFFRLIIGLIRMRG